MTETFVAPKPIKLTKREAELYSRIPKSPKHDEWRTVIAAMEPLAKSLLRRKAIPEVRACIFSDPDFAEKGTKSRQQVFESNGTSGDDILRHPHFLPYLRYFIHGPDLPHDAIDGLCTILNEDRGTSGMVMDQYRKFARASIRRYGLDPGKAATEFFRLGVEIGMEIHDARTLRDAAKSTK